MAMTVRSACLQQRHCCCPARPSAGQVDLERLLHQTLSAAELLQTAPIVMPLCCAWGALTAIEHTAKLRLPPSCGAQACMGRVLALQGPVPSASLLACKTHPLHHLPHLADALLLHIMHSTHSAFGAALISRLCGYASYCEPTHSWTHPQFNTPIVAHTHR